MKRIVLEKSNSIPVSEASLNDGMILAYKGDKYLCVNFNGCFYCLVDFGKIGGGFEKFIDWTDCTYPCNWIQSVTRATFYVNTYIQ